MTDNRVWLITGASAGFGRALAEAALEAGERVVLAVRSVGKVEDLEERYPHAAIAMPLDASDVEAPEELVERAIDWGGRVDVLVNNAGRGHVGAVEETPAAQLRDLMDLHLHGPAALIRAVLPRMREQGTGTIVNISSQGGRMSFAGVGTYSATKFAIEGLSEALAAEVAQFGIRVIIVEPGAFRTSFNQPGALVVAPALPEYAAISGAVLTNLHETDGRQPGDPAKAAQVIRDAIASGNPPLRLVLGGDAVASISRALQANLAEIDAWRDRSESTSVDQETGASRSSSS